MVVLSERIRKVFLVPAEFGGPFWGSMHREVATLPVRSRDFATAQTGWQIDHWYIEHLLLFFIFVVDILAFLAKKPLFSLFWALKGCKRVFCVFALSQIGVNLLVLITQQWMGLFWIPICAFWDPKGPFRAEKLFFWPKSVQQVPPCV